VRRLCCVLPFLVIGGCNLDFDGTPKASPELASQIAAAESAVFADENDASRRVAVADLYAEAGRVFEAADQLKKATELDPSRGGARVKLAELYQRIGYYTEAFIELRHCIERNPAEADCLYAIGGILKADGTPSGLDQAREVWERLISVAPNHPKAEAAKKGLAQIAAQRPASQPAEAPKPGALPEAGTAQLPAHTGAGANEDVGNLNPFGAAIGKAMAAVRAKDGPAAEAAFREALTISPDDPGALAGLAETLHTQNNPEEAERTAQRAYDLAPTHPQVRWVFGLIMLKRGRQIGPALEAWKALAKEEPEYAKQLGVIRTLDAIDQMRKAGSSGSHPQ